MQRKEGASCSRSRLKAGSCLLSGLAVTTDRSERKRKKTDETVFGGLHPISRDVSSNGQKYGCKNIKSHVTHCYAMAVKDVKDCVWTDNRFSEGVILRDEREEARGMFALCSLNFM